MANYYIRKEGSQHRRDTPADIAARRRRIWAGQQVNRERDERWPTITAQNVGEVLAWQENRLRELEA